MATAQAQTEVKTKLCTKCGVNPKAGGDSDANPWCKECRSQYKREYDAGNDWRMERRGILRGINAMRQHAASYFAQWGGRPFMGAEVAACIESLPGPAVEPEAKPDQKA